MPRLRPFLPVLLLSAGPALAQDGSLDPTLLPQIGTLLGKLLIVLILLESAMTALFNWRVYREVLAGRAWKTPIMFGLGLLVVWGFGYDPIAQALTTVAGGSVTEGYGWLSPVLSAMVFAGGSQGVYDLFRKLGIRSPIDQTPAPPRLEPDQAWLALRLRRDAAVGDIQIILSETSDPPKHPLIGSVNDRSLGQRLREALGLWDLRFPQTGGRLVKANVTYDLALLYATKADPATVHPIGSFAFAPRAIIDLDVTA